MIGLFLGTSEGREILRLLNEFTDNIYVSAATEYGGEYLKDYNYKYLNTRPLTQADMIKEIDDQGISIMIDATHPYATIVTENIIGACKDKEILYLRYERPSVINQYLPHPDIVTVDKYEDLQEKLMDIIGTIMNTTGSNNVEKLITMNLPNTIIHKVLPIKEVLTKLHDLKIPIKNIVAICGGGSKEFNKALFKEYDAKAVILKDSGKQGKTKEKTEAALELGMKVFIINREKTQYENIFESEEEIVRVTKNTIKGEKKSEK
ncbi:MAG TPA: cobalt-precorrin-6A reductase [Epulopiscium sp.]|nr:cobalt-precorrin-6A reductase [Candidatus Epulonipiscium sp.]